MPPGSFLSGPYARCDIVFAPVCPTGEPSLSPPILSLLSLPPTLRLPLPVPGQISLGALGPMENAHHASPTYAHLRSRPPIGGRATWWTPSRAATEEQTGREREREGSADDGEGPVDPTERKRTRPPLESARSDLTFLAHSHHPSTILSVSFFFFFLSFFPSSPFLPSGLPSSRATLSQPGLRCWLRLEQPPRRSIMSSDVPSDGQRNFMEMSF